MLNRLAVAVTVGLVFLSPTGTLAQATEEPELHYMTVTTFSVPLGEAGQDVMMWVDSVMVPLNRLNPNVLSFRVGRHAWGSDSGHVIMIAEYADWDAIEADCGAPCENWMEANQPEEGTPEADEWDKVQATFLKYYTGHKDDIYVVPVSRSK